MFFIEMKRKNKGRIMNDFQKKAIKIVVAWGIFCLVISILFNTVWMLSLIPSESMEDTIMAGEFVIATRYDRKDIERYDILIFIPPDNRKITYIKRVIGLPGETIEVKNGKVYADGVELDNSFIRNPQNRKGDGTYVVPEGCYFFLGDNRNNSKDSRFWNTKFVPAEDIKAKTKYIIFPFNHARSLDYSN